MKTLIISGSPRKNGDSMALVREMLRHIEGDTEFVYTYFDEISPCMDCRFCWKQNACCIQDRMQDVYRMLDEVDNVVMASPIYFSEVTGSLLNFASRLQRYYAARVIRKDPEFHIKRKNGVFLYAAGGDTKDMGCTLDRVRIIFKNMNAQLIGVAGSNCTDKVPAEKDTMALAAARDLAKELNTLYKKQQA